MTQGAGEKFSPMERFEILAKRVDSLFAGAGEYTPDQRHAAIVDCLECMSRAAEDMEREVAGHA